MNTISGQSAQSLNVFTVGAAASAVNRDPATAKLALPIRTNKAVVIFIFKLSIFRPPLPYADVLLPRMVLKPDTASQTNSLA
jgi:hypothetical protein